MSVWPAGWRLIAGTAICVLATLLLVGILLPSASQGRRSGWAYLAWEAILAVCASGVVAVFWGALPGLEATSLAVYVGGALLAFALTFLISRVVDFGHLRVTCGFCGRCSEDVGSSCPWCGVWLDRAQAHGPDEFVIPERSEVVHQKDCGALRSSGGASFETLAGAVRTGLGRGEKRVRACRRCLGLHPTWEPDPLWTRAWEWARELGMESEELPRDA